MTLLESIDTLMGLFLNLRFWGTGGLVQEKTSTSLEAPWKPWETGDPLSSMQERTSPWTPAP